MENVKGAVWTVDEVEFCKRRPQRSSGYVAGGIVRFGGAFHYSYLVARTRNLNVGSLPLDSPVGRISERPRHFYLGFFTHSVLTTGPTACLERDSHQPLPPQVLREV